MSPSTEWGKSRWLWMGAVGLLGLSVFQGIELFLWRPIERQQQRQTVLRQKVAAAEEQLQLVNAELSYLARERTRSIAGDPAIAANRYMQWLLRRTEQVGDIRVDATPAVGDERLGWLVHFQLQGSAPLDWLAQFVEEISGTPLQHRISYLKIEDAQSGTAVAFHCTLEALVLRGATALEQWPEQLAPIEDAAQLAKVLSAKSPFKRGYSGPRKEPQLVSKVQDLPKPPPPPPPIDPLATFRLIGLVSVNGVQEAWMMDSRTGAEVRAAEGETFAFAGRDLVLQRIDRDALEIAAGSRVVRWPIGSSLRSVFGEL